MLLRMVGPVSHPGKTLSARKEHIVAKIIRIVTLLSQTFRPAKLDSFAGIDHVIFASNLKYATARNATARSVLQGRGVGARLHTLSFER